MITLIKDCYQVEFTVSLGYHLIIFSEFTGLNSIASYQFSMFKGLKRKIGPKQTNYW